MEVGIAKDNFVERKPIFREALKPFLFFLKFFGLYFDCITDLSEGKKRSVGILQKIYSYLVFLMVLAVLGKIVSGLVINKESDSFYVITLHIVFYLKCAGQSFACLRLCSTSNSRHLWSFIEELEVFLVDIKLTNCQMIEKKFKQKLRLWLYVFIFLGVANTGGQIFIFVFSNSNEYTRLLNLTTIIVRPLSTNVEYRIGITLVNTICFAAFFLPTSLCGVLSQSMTYSYEELYRFIRHKKENGCQSSNRSVCMRSYISYVRLKYVKLSNMVKRLDDMVQHIYLVSFPLDIVLICLNLRVILFEFDDLPSRLYLAFWLIPPLFTLIALSHYSSQIVERGEEMHGIVQDFKPVDVTTDIQIELEMLMFHLTTQPAVMTICGMIPLYKSIIISIFVSIVTYFAILVTL